MRVTSIILLGETVISVNYDWHMVRTTFRDHTYMEMWVKGIPPADAQRWAEELGYEVPWDHFREHELIHTWLSMKMGYPHSPTLWTVAHENVNIYGKITRKSQGIEEWLVTQFQKFLNTGQYDPLPLEWLVDRGLNLTSLRTEALEFLREYLDPQRETNIISALRQY